MLATTAPLRSAAARRKQEGENSILGVSKGTHEISRSNIETVREGGAKAEFNERLGHPQNQDQKMLK